MPGIRVELELKDGSFTSGMLRAGQSLGSFKKELQRVDPHFRKLSRANDDVVRSVRRADKTNRSFLGTLRDITLVTGGLTLAFQSLIGTGGNLVSQITKVNAEIERMKFQMLGMSTSAKPMEEAAQSVEYLREQAKQMPFSLKQLSDSFVKLKATGTDPMKGSLQAISDGIAAFGGNDEALHRVTLGIRQMAGKSVIQMEEMRQQLGESMPNAMAIMARSMGVSIAELTKAISTGRVEASSALDSFFLELDRTYGGEAQRMMETFSGQVSQLQANLQILATSGGLKKFFEAEKSALQSINDFLQSSEAEKFADELGNALTGLINALVSVTRFAYEFRQEIIQFATIASGAIAFKALASGAGLLVTNLRAARLAMAGFRAEMVSSVSMMALGTNGLRTMQATGTSAALVMTGLKGAVVGVGRALTVAAPWLGILAGALLLASDRMNLFGGNTKEAYEELREFGNASREEAERIVSDRRDALNTLIADRQENLDLIEAMTQSERTGILGFGSEENFQAGLKDARDALKSAKDELKALNKEADKVIGDAGESEEDSEVRKFERRLQVRLREFKQNFRETQVELDRGYQEALASAAENEESAFQIRERYRSDTVENRKKQTEEIIAELDKESEAIKKMMEDLAPDERGAFVKMLDKIRTMRIDAFRDLDRQDEFGIKLIADIESEEKKIERAKKLLDKLNVEVRGMQAGLAGAGDEYAELLFKIERGDYGNLEDATDETRRLHEELKEATRQKEALDEAMEGRREIDRDIEAARLRIAEERIRLQAELKDTEMTDAELLLFRLQNGAFKGLGSENGIRADLESVAMQALKTGNALQDETFGDETIKNINNVRAAVLGLTEDLGSLSVGSLFGGFFGGSRSSGGGSRFSGFGGGILDLIMKAEGTSGPKGRGFNTTLDYGRWTGGEQNLVGMTLNQIKQLQSQMLANPANRALYKGPNGASGSSALGAFQITRRTLVSLMKEMGLTGDELFDEAMQTRMAERLLARRGNSVTGLRQEWQGLQNVDASTILRALGQGTGNTEGLVQSGVQKTKQSEAEIQLLIAQEKENKLIELEVARKERLKELNAALDGANVAFDEGADTNLKQLVEAIKQGKLGEELDPAADVYADLIAKAKELDKVEEDINRRKKARRQTDDQLKDLERERLDINRKIEEAVARAADPDYQGQSRDLTRLIEDLDEYVKKIRVAYGENSKAAQDAEAFRNRMINEQRVLDARVGEADMAEKTREIRDSLLSGSQLRRTEMNRQLRQVDEWLEKARAAGLEEVEITRRAEEMKAAIRQQYAQETNPLIGQMQEWENINENLMNKTTGWMDSAADGIAGLITGTGDLSGVVQSMFEDVINAQVRYLMSQMVGPKAAGGAGKLSGGAQASKGGSSKMAGVGKAVGVAHTGGIIGGRLASRVVSPGTFVGAPKFHAGGIVGQPRLKADEQPIIAKKKEGVFTPEQMAALGPAGGQNVSITAPVTVNASGGSPEQNQDLAKRMSLEMEKTMRGVVVDELSRQMRPGNMAANRQGGR